MKNTSRLSTVMGTWTVNANVRLDVGDYEMDTYVVLDIVCDPMKAVNSCEGCDEINNDVCLRENMRNTTCGSMATNISDWSDVLVNLYFGVGFKAGYPFNKDVSFSTGGWVGPYNTILAQNKTNLEDRGVVDSYVTRYVQTPATPYLRMNPDNDMMGWEDFDSYFGADSVRYTTTIQSELNKPNSTDPYEQYRTCDNGNVRPYLPIIYFDFFEDPETGLEKLDIQLDYKILVFPPSSTAVYGMLPRLEQKGFPLSGPYCYDDDPNRGWTVDISYDSTKPNIATLTHSCVEGLPCKPPALKACSTCVTVETEAPGKATTVHVGSLVAYFVSIGFMAIAIVFLSFRIFKMRKNIATTEKVLSINNEKGLNDLS